MNTIAAILALAAGAFLGGCARYGFTKLLAAPACTFAANLSGSLAIGLSYGLLTVYPDAWSGLFQPLAIVGFAGGLSTWSTLAKELGEMLKAKDYVRFARYLFFTVGLGIVFAWWGYRAAAHLGL